MSRYSRISMAGVAAVVWFAVATTVAAQHEHSETDHAHESETEADAPVTEAQPGGDSYVCPMHPEVTSDKPGKCPKCGMDLVLSTAVPAAIEPHVHEIASTQSGEESHPIEEGRAEGHDHSTDHGDAGESIALAQELGKFHPLVVHFPVALLLAAALSEAIGVVRRRSTISETSTFCVILGTLGAIFAAPLGWLDASGAEYAETFAGYPVVFIHRWLGVSTAVLAAAAMGLCYRARSPRGLNAFRIVLFAAAIAVAVTGHFGAALVYGMDYFNLGV